MQRYNLHNQPSYDPRSIVGRIDLPDSTAQEVIEAFKKGYMIAPVIRKHSNGQTDIAYFFVTAFPRPTPYGNEP